MKTKKLINLIIYLLKNPLSVAKGIRKVMKSEKEIYVREEYGLERGLPFVDILDLIDKKQTISNYSCLVHSSLLPDVMLLKGLARRIKNCKYLEIGTWKGETISNVSDVAEECKTIDINNDEMIGFFSKRYNKNILHINEDSTKIDYSNLGKFDLIFIDGDHSYEAVKEDTKNMFKLLRNEDSIIVWHDAGTNFENNHWNIIAGILDGCPEDKRNKIYRVSNTLCAIYYPNKIESKFYDYPRIPEKEFKFDVEINKIK